MAGSWKVGEGARMARVTVRTLHHYDEIGLLVPSGRSEAGYRLYAREDLERLHQILLYRELGFTLEGTRRVLDEPALDRRAALVGQRELLLEKRRKTDAVLRAVERALETLETGGTMDADEMFEGFEDFAHAEHAEEAKDRWGDTEAYKESMRRAKAYSKEDWRRIKGEADALEAEMASLLAAGEDPSAEAAAGVAEGMRKHIDDWFYPCSHRMHVGLADLYEADPRFTEHYDERAPGLAGFVAAAIRANARRAG